jgi:RND family efflux transporter MFP subunit
MLSIEKNKTFLSSLLVLTGLLFFSASVYAESKVVIGALVSGQVSKLYVAEGDSVNKGDKLLTLDSARYQAKKQMLQANLKIAKIGLDDAKIELDQALDLYDRTVTSKRTLDASQMRYDQALAGFEQANATLKMHRAWEKYVYIKAPVAGKVVKIHTPLGSTVFKENTPMIEIE